VVILLLLAACSHQPGRQQIAFKGGVRAGELNGTLSGSAGFTLLLTRFGQRSIFAANRPYRPHGISAPV